MCIKRAVGVVVVACAAFVISGCTPAQKAAFTRWYAAQVSETSKCGAEHGLPPCYVKERESGGDYRAVSPAGFCDQPPDFRCHGAWQLGAQTAANAARGMGRPDLANIPAEMWSPSEQNDAARWVFKVQGCAAWNC